MRPAPKLKHIPSKERQEAWLRVARKPYTEEEREAARGKLVQLLNKMEEALAASGFLVGGAYSIADIAAVPFVKRIDEEIAPDQVSHLVIGDPAAEQPPMRRPKVGTEEGETHGDLRPWGQRPLQSSRQIALRGRASNNCSCKTSTSCSPSP